MAQQKAARIASGKVAVTDRLSRRKCACGCGNLIPIKSLLTVITAIPTVTRPHKVYYVREHYK
jgi:hypothetical protein